MMQEGPWTKYAAPQQAPSAPAQAPWERYQAPQAAPARRPQRPAQPRPQGAPQAAPSPTLNELGITDAEERDTLIYQGYTPEEADRLIAERLGEPSYDAAPVAGPANSTGPSPASGFDLPPGVVDWNNLSDAERTSLGEGARVLMPQNEGETFRQIVTLRGRPYYSEGRDTDQMFGSVRGREENSFDRLGAFASGAGEQVPLLDEAATLAGAVAKGQSFSEARGDYRDMQSALNEQEGGYRDAGGVAGFVGALALPGVGEAKYVAQGATRGAQIGRAMQVGGLTGAVYGGTAGEGGLEERATGAAIGGGAGAATGGVLNAASPYAAEAARRLMSGFSEAGSVFSRGMGRVAPDAEITPEATTGAQQYLARLVESSGADLSGNPIAAMGKPITAAEAIGPSGIANMAALTRRSGRAGNMAQSQLGARAVEQPSRVVQDFADLTGMDPAGSADMIQNLATTGRARARPIYDEAYSMQVQPSPLIENILARPVGQAALRRAYKIARNEGRNPEELGLFVVSRNEPRATGVQRASRDPELFADLDAMRAGRGVRGAGQGQTLLEFISQNGGVRDDGGELAQIGADIWNRQGSWRSRAVRDEGLSLEQMADRARAAGFFGDVTDAAADSADNYQRISSQDVINAIEGELRGYPSYARAVGDTDRSAAAVARRARREALDERLNREGIDLSKAANDDVARLLSEADDAEARALAHLEGEGLGEPQIEFLPGEVPSMQTLDYVKRGLDDVVNNYRDSTTRRLNLNEEGRSVVGAVSQFRDELVRLTGGDDGAYARALSAGGDPIRLEEAFRQSDRLFGVGIPQRTFMTATERMGEAERNALVAGFADRLFRDAQSGRLSTRQINQLNVPVTREKLASLIGPEGADSFMQRIGAEIELARSGGRMAPGTNSVTAEALAAMAEQDGTTGFTADLARNMAAGRGDILGALALTAGKAAVAPATGFVRGMTVAKPQAVRDEIARLLLLSPEELQAQLTAAAGSSRPDAGALAKALQAAAGPGAGRTGAGFAQPEAQNARPANRRAAQ